MKKILLLLIIIVFSFTINAQITGSGTSSSDPFTGSMSSGIFNIPTGTSFFHQITVSGGTLNIAEGATLKATQTSSFFTISGTGIFNADGDSGADMITFTSDVASWARITFSSGSASLIDYCIIEKGLVTGSGYGGGLLINNSNITVSNSIFRENNAGYGGAVFVNSYASPTITNCHIYSNTATIAGGGLYIYTRSAAHVYNCLIEENQCTNTTNRGGGGISTYTTAGLTRIINCTIVNNVHVTPNTNYGNNIEVHDNNSGLRYINCVVWGGENPCVYRSGAAQFYATNFVNSALQSVFSSGGETNINSYTNCFKLNSSNEGSSPDGPYFSAIDGSDWSIRFRSPCRDAGTNSYGSPNIVPATDYAGESRIYTTDIGAYEVQYSRWTGATNTTWSEQTNWDSSVSPDIGTGDVFIPSSLTNYPTGGTISDFTVGNGNAMIISPGAKATLGALTNNGILRLESNATAISSLITASYSGNNTDVQLYLTGGFGSPSYRWHLISSPFTSFNDITPITNVTPNLAQWVENMASADLSIGWVAYNGYIYVSGGTGGPTFSNLDKGKGYNHYYSSPYTYTLSGQLNTTDAVCALPYTVTDPDEPTRYGLNVLGNPFSSGLDWQAITFGAYASSFPTNTSKVLHYRREGFAVYFINGSGSAPGVTGIIPPMQGFFTKTYSTGNSITLPAGARTNDAIPARYKGKSVIPHVMINLNSSDFNDYTVVKFDNEAKSDLDYDFDAEKREIVASYPYLYTLTDGVKYAINGQPFPETQIEIPLIINLTQSGNHTLGAVELEGLEDYSVSLKDNSSGFIADLKSTPVYSFSADAGLISGRFTLIFNNVTVNVETPASKKEEFNIYQSQGLINLQPLNDDWNGLSGSVIIYDLSGRPVNDKKSVELWKNSIIQVQSPAYKGLYLVEISSGVKRFVAKVIIN